MDRRTKQGKADWEDLQLSGKEIVSASDWEEINILKENIMNHPVAGNVLKGAECEGALFGNIQGVPVRGKIDMVNKGFVIDLKSCQDASESEFVRSVIKYSYHQQAAFYMELCKQNGLEANGFLFICVERLANGGQVACRSMEQVWLDAGKISYETLIDKYKDHKNNPEKFNGYSDSIEPLPFPKWM
jgi:hypothetical protein